MKIRGKHRVAVCIAVALVICLAFKLRRQPRERETRAAAGVHSVQQRYRSPPGPRGVHDPSTAGFVPPSSCPYYPRDVADVETRIFARESVLELRSQLADVPRSTTVHLLLASEGVLALLANWLCVSRLNLDNLKDVLIIVPPGDSMASILRSKGIRAVQMNYSQWCQQRMPENEDRTFMRAIAARVLSIRLLTSWEYNVAVYDPDAFVTRNVTQLYSSIGKELQADAIFQRGHFPPKLREVWGFTVCCGAAYYRGTTRLEILWKEMAELQQSFGTTKWHKSRTQGHKPFNKSLQMNDQMLTNAALFQVGIKWSQTNVYESMLGSLDGSRKLNIVALGTRFSARHWPLERDDELVVAHPNIGHGLDLKIRKLGEHKLWKLAVQPHLVNDHRQYDNPDNWLKKICAH